MAEDTADLVSTIRSENRAEQHLMSLWEEAIEGQDKQAIIMAKATQQFTQETQENVGEVILWHTDECLTDVKITLWVYF